MKSLKPSMREKKRYLLVSGGSKEKIERVILEFIGINGMSKCGLEFVKKRGDKLIIGVNREMVDSVRASLVVFKEKIGVERVSGTLKGLGKWTTGYIPHYKKSI